MKAKEGEHPFGDTGQLILLVAFLIIWVADSFFLRYSTGLSSTVPLMVRLIVLIAIFIAAFWLFQSGHSVVGHGEPPRGVVTAGAFRYVRHPLYLASILAYIGLAVSTASILSLIAAAGISVFYDHIAGYEEEYLERKYDLEYTRYKARTGKWVPRVR